MKPRPRSLSCLRAGVALACPTLLMSGTVPDDYSVTGVGWFYCYDGSADTTMPLAGARVVLMDSDCDGSTICDDEMGSSYIQDDGRFQVTGKGGDPGSWSWSRPDVYIRVVFNDGNGVRLTDELDWDRYTDTPQHDHDNTVDGSVVDFGVWTTGTDAGPGEGSRCGVWQAGRRAYGEYVALMNEPPPAGHWDIEYWSAIWAGTPWTNDNTTHWPIHWPSSSAHHEFGHSIRHAADGDRNHFNWDVTRFRYARNHVRCDPNANRIGGDTPTMDQAFGFNEGWSEFWEGATGGCWAVSIEEALEGNVAFALGQLSAVPGVDRRRMVEVLKANPGKIHSIGDFINYLSPAVGQSVSRLTQSVDSARRVPAEAVAEVAFKPVTPIEVRAVMGRERENLVASIRSIERELEVARDAVRSVRPCRLEECETAMKTAVRPIMLEADLEIRRLAGRRLESLTRMVLDESFYQQLASGRLDTTLAQLREQHRREIYRIHVKALEQARRVSSTLSRRGSQGEEFAREFTLELKALQARAREGEGGMNQAGIARLAEGGTIPGRFAPHR